MGVIKVAIADDHKIFRKGVILSLRPYSAIKFVQEAENGQELLDGLAASEPDVVLMDLRMPQKDGMRPPRSSPNNSLPSTLSPSPCTKTSASSAT